MSRTLRQPEALLFLLATAVYASLFATRGVHDPGAAVGFYAFLYARSLVFDHDLDFRNDYVTVIAPIEGSPAARAGIKPGDQILAVDGKPMRGERIDKLVTLMRGPRGSKVTLSVRRAAALNACEADVTQPKLARILSSVRRVVNCRILRFIFSSSRDWMNHIRPLTGSVFKTRQGPCAARFLLLTSCGRRASCARRSLRWHCIQ